MVIMQKNILLSGLTIKVSWVQRCSRNVGLFYLLT